MQEQGLPEALKIPRDRLVSVCRYRQTGCCRYVVLATPGDFFCAKRVAKLKVMLDEAVLGMKAKGDNCEGLG